MNKSELQRSFEDILNKTIDQWKENDDKDSLDMAEQGETWIDDYINDPEWGLVASTMRDMEKYVHRSDTGMSGNFADIRLDWEREHEDVSLDEVVEMIDNGEVNDITNEFRSWSIDWYFRAFGTYNLKYNWSEFISNEVAEMDYERERDSKVDESNKTKEDEVQTTSIKVNPNTYNWICKALDSTPEEMDVPQEEATWKVTGKFDDGTECDIILHASEDDFYLDGVLYDEDGSELCMTEPCYDILGDWEFEYDGTKYVCTVNV